MLREAGAEHGKALIVNTASIAGKSGQAWLSVYSATKAGVIGFSQATQKEVARPGDPGDGAVPGFVDTPMTEFVKGQVRAEEMIRPEDIAEAVRFLLRTSPACLVPEIVFLGPDEQLGGSSAARRCSASCSSRRRAGRCTRRSVAPGASRPSAGGRGARARGGARRCRRGDARSRRVGRWARRSASASRSAIAARSARIWAAASAIEPGAELVVGREAHLEQRAEGADLAAGGAARALGVRCSGPRRGRSWRGWCGRRFGGRRASGRCRRREST